MGLHLCYDRWLKSECSYLQVVQNYNLCELGAMILILFPKSIQPIVLEGGFYKEFWKISLNSRKTREIDLTKKKEKQYHWIHGKLKFGVQKIIKKIIAEFTENSWNWLCKIRKHIVEFTENSWNTQYKKKFREINFHY